MEKKSKIYVAGHQGLVGSAIVRALQSAGYKNLLLRTHEELDLVDAMAVAEFFRKESPEYVFLAAAKVGGILANQNQPADFIYQNLMIQTNVIHQAYLGKVKKLLYLGSSCIYPKECPQPIKEEYLLTGPLETSNLPYAIAKITGIKMCQSYNRQYHTNFIAVMPTNLYGPCDNFDLENSHVLPALIRKFHEAKQKQSQEVVVWGTGKPRREFLYVEDMADGCIFLMDNFNLTPEQNKKGEIFFNLGVGEDIEILELAGLIKNIVGFEGKIVFDKSKPDGTMRKLMDVSKIMEMGWQPVMKLEDGIKKTYQWFLEQYQYAE